MILPLPTERPVVLVTLGALWPGHESAGPNLSQMALCKALSDEFDFRILARDRPFGANTPIVDNQQWHDLGWAKVHYLTPRRFGSLGLFALLRNTPHDLLIINSFLDRDFSTPALLWNRFLLSRRAPVLLSPRGEFSSGALALKAAGKRLYRLTSSMLGLMNGIVLHATSADETDDLKRAFPHHAIHQITNFRPLFDVPDHTPRSTGEPLRVAFVGRISRVKGLDFALEILADVKAAVRYDIFGPISDPIYWAECEALITALPAHIQVRHCGEISNEAVATELGARDLLLLPSKSENFGHAIFESLAAGTPVLIGDKTPWRNLESSKAGFDLPLDQPAGFARAIDQLAAQSRPEQWRKGARQVAETHVRESEAPAKMRTLLRSMISEFA